MCSAGARMPSVGMSPALTPEDTCMCWGGGGLFSAFMGTKVGLSCTCSLFTLIHINRSAEVAYFAPLQELRAWSRT